jgi:hypothetical protein
MSRNKKYFGNYLGIVVQNNDPQRRGRIKVFVPHISPAVYSGWTNTNNDKKFKFVGSNINSSINEILDDLKIILPWADYAGPVTGEASSGRFNYIEKIGSISDSSRLSDFAPDSDKKDDNPETQNVDNIGEKPGNLFEAQGYKINDAFSDPTFYNTNIANKYSYNYVPSTYSNKSKGTFGVPSVGAHVWVFFNGGDIMKPVYFAISYGKEDWKGIYDNADDSGNDSPGQDYPGLFENYSLSGENNFDINVDTYRNKYVINQRGGSIEFVNSTNRESLKITHFSGSFKEFNNYTNIEFASNSDQKLVQNDQFLTVYGSKNLYVERDFDNVIRGDVYKKIGNLNPEPHIMYKQTIRELAKIKQLFETKRTDAFRKEFIDYTSPYQTKSGTPASCPVCVGGDFWYYKLNSKFAFHQPGETTSLANTPFFRNGIPSVAPFGFTQPFQVINSGQKGKIFGITCPACGGSGLSPSSQNGKWAQEDKTNKIKSFLKNNINKLNEYEQKMGLGGSEIISITKHKIETIGMDINDLPSTRVDLKGKMSVNAVIIGTDGGVFNSMQPSPVVEYVHVDDLPGGNYNLTVCNRFNVMVGSGGINLKTYGPVHISGTITNIAGQQINISSENEVYIDGGKKLQLIGDIVNIKQRNNQQVVIDSNLGVTTNVVVGGGAHIEGELYVNHITAPTEISETQRQTVTGTTNNVLPKIIGYLGFSAPAPTPIGYVFTGDAGVQPVYASATGQAGGPPVPIFSKTASGLMPEPDSVIVYAHSHTFKSIPMTLVDSNNDVRKLAREIHNPTGKRIPALPPNNASK